MVHNDQQDRYTDWNKKGICISYLREPGVSSGVLGDSAGPLYQSKLDGPLNLYIISLSLMGNHSLQVQPNNLKLFKWKNFSGVRLKWIAAHQASLSITNSWSLLQLMSIKLVMPSNHLILCCPLLLLLSNFPSIRSFPMSQLFASGGQNIRVSASTSIFPMNIQD